MSATARRQGLNVVGRWLAAWHAAAARRGVLKEALVQPALKRTGTTAQLSLQQRPPAILGLP